MSRSVPWSEKDIRRLKDMYAAEKSIKDICKELGRSERSIANKAYKLRLGKNVNFTEEEIEYIKENYLTMNTRELSENIGRGDNWQNVCRKAKELGLTGKKAKIKHKDRPEPTVRVNKYKNDRERSEAHSEMMKEWHKNNEHPRGMKGKTHSNEYRKRRSLIMKEVWADPESYLNSSEYRQKVSKRMSNQMIERIKKRNFNSYSRGKGGIRKDIGIYVRSTWEANVARYLNLLKKENKIFKWEYESETFRFYGENNGTRSYTPDFKIWETEHSKHYFLEVKGYMDERSKDKLKMMDEYYPEEKIIIIGEKEYNDIRKLKDKIENFE